MRASQITGIEIVVRAVLEVVRNLNTALRISVPWLAPLAVFFASDKLLPADVKTSDYWLVGLLVGVLPMVIYLFLAFTAIAVAWHRLILKDEIPNFPFAFSSQWQLGRYFLWGLPLGLVLFLPETALIYFAPDDIMDLSWLALHSSVMIGASYVFYRLCVLLPAIALKRRGGNGEGNRNPYTFAWAWRATRPFAAQILLASAVTSGFSIAIEHTEAFVLEWLAALGNGWAFYAGEVANVISHWCWIMFPISMLTTLYAYACMQDDQSSGSSRSV